MIKYKVTGSYVTKDNEVISISPKDFTNDIPFYAREEALNWLRNLWDVITDDNDNIKHEMFYEKVISKEPKILKGNGKKITIKPFNLTLSHKIELRYFVDDEKFNEIHEIDDDGYIIDFVGHPDLELIEDIADNLKIEYKFFKDNNLLIGHKKNIKSYSMDTYLYDNKLEPETFFYIPTYTDISITENPFWWEPEKLREHLVSSLLVSTAPLEIPEILEQGENSQIEFKPSLYFNFRSKEFDNSVRFHIAKSICAFLNTDGGKLFIGINDEKQVQGLELFDFSLTPCGKDEKDFFRLEFSNTLTKYFSKSVIPFIGGDFKQFEGKTYFEINVSPSANPVFLQIKEVDKETNKSLTKKLFFIRIEASSHRIFDTEEIVGYILNRLKPK